MSEKAKLSGDQVSYYLKMASVNHGVHKSLGRRVHSTDRAKWEPHREGITLTGSNMKFTQSAPLLTHLLAAGGRILAESSPFDSFWGVGNPACYPHTCQSFEIEEQTFTRGNSHECSPLDERPAICCYCASSVNFLRAFFVCFVICGLVICTVALGPVVHSSQNFRGQHHRVSLAVYPTPRLWASHEFPCRSVFCRSPHCFIFCRCSS